MNEKPSFLLSIYGCICIMWMEGVLLELTISQRLCLSFMDSVNESNGMTFLSMPNLVTVWFAQLPTTRVVSFGLQHLTMIRWNEVYSYE